jgi:predicted amidohydrolase
VAGVNRVGADPSNEYSGGSMVIDPYGKIIAECVDGVEMAASAEIDMDMLETFRAKFPVLNDSDVI